LTKPVPLPANVAVAVADSSINVEWAQGEARSFRREIGVRHDEPASRCFVERRDDEREPGCCRPDPSLIANMVQGSPPLATKKLEIVGVGYQRS
jgi:ribosomal protein L6P/L9E